MDHPLSIRLVRDADAIRFRELRLEAFRGHPEAFGTDYEDDLALPDSVWSDRMRKAMTDPNHAIVVADAEGQLVGMTGVWRDVGRKVRHNATIWGVYVRQEYRGRKVGQQMIEAVLNWCRTKEARMVRLTVTTSNTAAIACYVACGFHVYGVGPE